MTTAIMIFTALLAGLAAAAMLWFGTDLAYRLRFALEQRRRAKKLADLEEANKAPKAKGKKK